MKEYIDIIIFLLALVFNTGMIYRKINSLPEKEEVNKMIDEKIKQRFDSELGFHISQCPLKEDLLELEDKLILHKEKTLEDLEYQKRLMLELRINLKNICEKLGIKYHNGTEVI